MIITIFLMVLGVIGYSIAIGQLSSVISSNNSKIAKWKERQNTLNSIREEFNMSFDLYMKLKSHLHLDYS